MSRPRRFDWLFRPQMADEDLPLSAEALFAEALAELPAVERSALALSEIGGLDTNEIAERLGTNPAVVRRLLDRGRATVRASLSARGRNGLAALLPFQSWWQAGSAAPVVRATGVVVATVVGASLAIGGATAEAPRATMTSPDPPPPRAQALERPARGALGVRAGPATTAAAVARTRRDEARGVGRRSVRPGVARRRDRDAVAAAVAPPPRPEPAAPPVGRERPAPPPLLVLAEPESVVVTLPLPVATEPPLPSPVELPPVELPEVPPLPPLPPLP